MAIHYLASFYDCVVNSGSKEYERGALSLVSADSLPISDRDLLLEYPMDEFFFLAPKYEL